MFGCSAILDDDMVPWGVPADGTLLVTGARWSADFGCPSDTRCVYVSAAAGVVDPIYERSLCQMFKCARVVRDWDGVSPVADGSLVITTLPWPDLCVHTAPEVETTPEQAPEYRSARMGFLSSVHADAEAMLCDADAKRLRAGQVREPLERDVLLAKARLQVIRATNLINSIAPKA